MFLEILPAAGASSNRQVEYAFYLVQRLHWTLTSVQSNQTPIPPYLLAHPTEFPGEPPVAPRHQSLPIDKLSWENFERLCLRLERVDAELETCRVYGTRGQSQEGIDVYSVERATGKHRVLQCKRVERFGPSKLSAAVDLFLEGTWASTAMCFTLCTTLRLESTQIVTEIENQRSRLRDAGIRFQVWDAAELDVLLKGQAEIVDDFFGRDWARLFCPSESIDALQRRATGPAVAQMRSKLAVLYTRVFAAHDPGLSVELGSRAPVPLRDRYVVPDIYEDRVESRQVEAPRTTTPQQEAAGQGGQGSNPSAPRVARATDIPRQRRKLNDWLTDQMHQVLIGGPGLGKSTLLRYVTLDVLSESPTLTQASSLQDTYLPVWVSYPFWTARIEESPNVLSILDVIQAWLHLWSEDRLWPLIEAALNDERLLLMVDGLDEYRSEDSARRALAQLQVFAEQRNCRVLATARPAGYDRLGVQRTGWQATHLAEFTLAQQKEYAVRWFSQQRKLLGEVDEQQARDTVIESAAARFMAELRLSADLSELAKTPLLLGLLLYLKSSSIPLPNSRYRAFGRLIEHLISVHPIARRRASMVRAQDNDLTPEDARIVFADLAFYMQSHLPEGLIDRPVAEDVVSQFLRDDVFGFGLSQIEARRQARTLLTLGEQALGLLVERGPQELGFLHRSFQEYLAAEHIARKPFADQTDFVKQHCTEPVWQEVLLSLLHLTRRPEEVGAFVSVLGDGAKVNSDRFITMPIRCEIAVGDFQCPTPLARKICSEVIDEIEGSPWLRHRETLLQSLLVGLFSPKVRDLIEARLRSWVPGRPWRYSVPVALARGTQSSDVVECLLRLLMDEDETINNQASAALASLADTHPEIANRLIELLGLAYPLSTQIAVLNALSIGWPNHEEWPRIVAEIQDSPSMDLRMIAIRRKVDIGSQTLADRDQVLSWACTRAGLRMLYGGSFATTLLKGWPGDDMLRSKALEAIRPNAWGDDLMDMEVALVILGQGFVDDREVRDAIGLVIKDDQRQYIWMHHCVWLYERLKGVPEIIDAVDEWLKKHDSVMTREVSFFARIGCTDIGKQRLIEGLSQSFPFWCAEALLDHWGMQDQEVSTALTDLANSPRAAEIGHILPRILSDPEACRQRLMALLRDTECRRADTVLLGLVRLSGAAGGEEIVATAMPFTERETLFDPKVKDLLFSDFSRFSEVKELAKRQLSLREGNLASVAEFMSKDDEIRSGIIAIMNPLPAVLREVIVSFLCSHRSNLPWAYELFAQYDLEADPGIKTQMAVAHYEHLVESGTDLTDAKNRLRHEIVVGGPDHTERRQAAYCGMQVVGMLHDLPTMSGIYHQGPPHIDLYKGLKTNYPMIEFVLANWSKIRAALGDGFWASLSGYHRDQLSLWSTLCLLADNYAEPRAEALDFIRNERERATRQQVLDFVARVQPRSTLLRDLCLKSLFSISNDSENDPEKAIELLTRDFSGDPVVRDALEAKLRREFHMHGHRAMWALCEFAPDEPILVEEMERLRPELFRNGDWLIQSSFDMALVCAVGTSQEVFSIIRFILRGCRPNYRYFAGGFQRPLVRRVRIDSELQAMLLAELKNTQNPSEHGSFLALLALATGMSPELREWCRRSSEPEPDRLVTPFGMDLITGLLRPVPEFAATALLESIPK
jgi:hypothetical protein